MEPITFLLSLIVALSFGWINQSQKKDNRELTDSDFNRRRIKKPSEPEINKRHILYNFDLSSDIISEILIFISIFLIGLFWFLPEHDSIDIPPSGDNLAIEKIIDKKADSIYLSDIKHYRDVELRIEKLRNELKSKLDSNDYNFVMQRLDTIEMTFKSTIISTNIKASYDVFEKPIKK